MYGFTTCYLATWINTMTSGNGLLSLYLTIVTVKDNEKKDFGKHCWKGENAGYQHSLLFQRCSLS